MTTLAVPDTVTGVTLKKEPGSDLDPGRSEAAPETATPRADCEGAGEGAVGAVARQAGVAAGTLPEEAQTETADVVAAKGPRAIAITGAAGYVGRLVVQAFAKVPGTVETILALDLREVPAADRIDGVTYVAMDIGSDKLGSLLKEHKIETVVHLAAILRPRSREQAYQAEVLGTKNLLEGCLAAEVRHFIVTSSGAAYGYHADNAAWLDEDDPIRGNEEFVYADHKRQIEELLSRHRTEHPALTQLVFRPGTILGETTSNPITDLFERRFVLGIRGIATPFVFMADEDVVRCIETGVREGRTGTFNLAGDGVMTLRDIASYTGKRYVPLAASLLRFAMWIGRALRLTEHGPEHVGFLEHRPVLANDRLKAEFGYTPRYSSREVFERYWSAKQKQQGSA